MKCHLNTRHKKRTIQLLLSCTWQIIKIWKKSKKEREKRIILQPERGTSCAPRSHGGGARGVRLAAAWGDALSISQWLRRPDSGGEVLAVGLNPVFIFGSRLHSRRSDIAHKTAWMMRMALLMSGLKVALVYAREQDMNGNGRRNVTRNMDAGWARAGDVDCNFLIQESPPKMKIWHRYIRGAVRPRPILFIILK